MLAPIVIGSIVSFVVLVTGAVTAFAFQTSERRPDRQLQRNRSTRASWRSI
jgi:hypothetical protein